MAVLLAAAAIVGSVVWIGSSAGAQPGPVLVEPPVPTPVATTHTTSAATSAPVTASPRVRHTTRPALPVPPKSRVTTEPAPRTSPTAKAALSANYGVRSSWDTGFIGGPLEPGATQSLGFEATKQATGEARPTSCTANGSWCRMS